MSNPAATCWRCGWQPELHGHVLIAPPTFCPKCGASWSGSPGEPEPEVKPAPSRLTLIARAIDAAVYPASAYQTEDGRNTRVDAVLVILKDRILLPWLEAIAKAEEEGEIVEADEMLALFED